MNKRQPQNKQEEQCYIIPIIAHLRSGYPDTKLVIAKL